MGAAIGASMGSSDALLMGRKTYAEWVGFWPTAEDGMADFMNGATKYVASTTLDEVTWQNSQLLEGDVAEAVTKIKQEPGGTSSCPAARLSCDRCFATGSSTSCT
jgi:dihydrofolate reductase